MQNRKLYTGIESMVTTRKQRGKSEDGKAE